MVALPPNILWTPLSGNHIHWHSQEKSKNLSLLVVKERQEGGLTDCSYTAVPHKSFLIRIAPEVQVEITNGFCNVLLKPFKRTYHIHCSSPYQN